MKLTVIQSLQERGINLSQDIQEPGGKKVLDRNSCQKPKEPDINSIPDAQKLRKLKPKPLVNRQKL